MDIDNERELHIDGIRLNHRKLAFALSSAVAISSRRDRRLWRI